MKKIKMNTLNTLSILLLAVIVIPGCKQTGNTALAQSGVNTPEVDIHSAVLTGNIEAVKQHIEAGSDLNEKEPFGGSTPLITAATFGKTEIAKALIEGGADISPKNNDGSTALHAAAFFGRIEIVQLLIDVKADKSIRNNFGATARESVMGPFAEIKPVYDIMQQQLGPLGLQLDMKELERSRPVVAMMLQ